MHPALKWIGHYSIVCEALQTPSDAIAVALPSYCIVDFPDETPDIVRRLSSVMRMAWVAEAEKVEMV